MLRSFQSDQKMSTSSTRKPKKTPKRRNLRKLMPRRNRSKVRSVLSRSLPPPLRKKSHLLYLMLSISLALRRKISMIESTSTAHW